MAVNLIAFRFAAFLACRVFFWGPLLTISEATSPIRATHEGAVRGALEGAQLVQTHCRDGADLLGVMRIEPVSRELYASELRVLLYGETVGQDLWRLGHLILDALLALGAQRVPPAEEGDGEEVHQGQGLDERVEEGRLEELIRREEAIRARQGDGGLELG
eukprot:scaffold87325_cov48-Phaeocystis_antarctica.AAC.5